MEIELSKLIFQVRKDLSDLPEEYTGDSLVYQSLRQSFSLIKQLSTIEEHDVEFVEHCIVTLATYYTYLNYTSLSETMHGSIPATAEIKLQRLFDRAYAFITKITDVEIDRDFEPDMDKFRVMPVSLGMSRIRRP